MVWTCVICTMLALYAGVMTFMVAALCDSNRLYKNEINWLRDACRDFQLAINTSEQSATTAARLQADELHDAKKKNVELAKRLAAAQKLSFDNAEKLLKKEEELKRADRQNEKLIKDLESAVLLKNQWRAFTTKKHQTLRQIKELVKHIPEEADGQEE